MRAIPQGGVGLGYRPPLRTHILRHLDELDFLEVITDSFLRNEPALRALASLKPCIPHSLNLSVGSETEPAYLESVARLVEATDPPWHSDHLAFTRAGEVVTGHLAPVAYTEESFRVVRDNVRAIQRRIGRPFALENITMPFYWPDDEMPEHEFLARLVKETGCLLLLDLENVRVNRANHGRGGRDFLDRLPLESVVQVHVAGGTHANGMENDTHSEPVSEETWGLLEHLCGRVPPPAVLIERDSSFPPFPELLGEVRRARSITRGIAA